jgi:tetratricopeptide (TPR) repeat protein
VIFSLLQETNLNTDLMKTILLLFILCCFFSGGEKYIQRHSYLLDYSKTTVATCGSLSPSENIETADNGKFMMLLPDWGDYSYQISTTNDSAQTYFNQGLTMYYSYHMKEALASFKEAAKFDPNCAMTYWGQALAMGPSYNSAHLYLIPKNVSEVLKLMNTGKASANERDLLKVMNLRYPSSDVDTVKKDLNTAYAQGMKALISIYPEDADVKVLFIDAVMLIHPWEFWNNDGSAKEWTPELVDLCKTVLQEKPKHPGALHYYIHLTEASPEPGRALPNAQLLKDLFPGVAHMVHMSSHVYQRSGLYALGVEANDKADASLVRYDSLARHLSLNKHSSHYYAVQAFCGLTGGMYTKGIQDAIRCRKSVEPSYEDTYAQYLYMMPTLTLVRLGKWDELLKDTVQPDARWTYARILNNFTKGLAYVYTDKPDLASEQLAQLRSKISDPILKKRRIPFNTTLQGAKIAENILNAVILFDRKKNVAGIKSLNKAIKIEDELIYAEPMDWPIPARQFLGAYLLKLKKPTHAAQVYKMDLELNPGNGWSLLGLYQSLNAQHKVEAMAEYKAAYLKAFSNAEQIPPASVYGK